MTEVAHLFFYGMEVKNKRKEQWKKGGVTWRRGKEKVSEFYGIPRIRKHFLWGKERAFVLSFPFPEEINCFASQGEMGKKHTQ